MDLVDQLGASATPMPFGELYTGLQQGVVDGAENNPPSYYDTRHYEVAPFYTLDEHTRVPDVIMVSEATWMKLDAQERKWLRNSVQASMAVQRQYWKDYEQAVLGMLETEGVTIIQPDKKLFQVAAEPMWSQIQNVHVKELIRRIQSFPRGSVSSEL